jgi:YesN/AraC family two-component response regulator
MILIVEDDIRLAMSIKENFEYRGYNTHYVTTIHSALMYLTTNIPDVIISDILLSDNNGFTLLEHIKANNKFDKTGFIFISAMTNSEYVIKGFKLGAQDYLRKPFSVKELEYRVKNLINQNNRIDINSDLPIKLLEEDRFFKNINVGGKDFKKVLITSIGTILKEHIANKNLTAETLASLIGMKKYKLEKFIQWQYGLTIASFIKKYKWSKAKEMLVRKEGDIKATSNALGFKNPSYFKACFEIKFNESPNSFYNRLNQTEN